MSIYFQILRYRLCFADESIFWKSRRYVKQICNFCSLSEMFGNFDLCY